MQVAEILSDLTSLRVCGHSQALALVNVHRNISEPSTSAPNESDARGGEDVNDSQNPDLKRAHELVHLHFDIKEKHFQGQDWVVDEELQQARANVNRVLQDLKRK